MRPGPSPPGPPARNTDTVRIVNAKVPDDYRRVAELFREYVASLPFRLTFQNFERELAEIERRYGPPGGRALLALVGDAGAGAVGVQRLDAAVCEMKRMFVRPAFRGRGIGRALGVAIVGEARRLGSERMRLDTTVEMAEAITLYLSLGFVDIEPYRYNPLPGARFLELRL